MTHNIKPSALTHKPKLNFQDFLESKKSHTDLSAAPLIRSSENVFSQNTHKLVQRIEDLKNLPRSSTTPTAQANAPIELQLFDASSNLKILTSKVAMHLNSYFRNRLFSQIDYLHNVNGWDPDDKPIQTASFYTFLRIIISIKPDKFPSLGLSFNGNLLGAWVIEKDRLTIEFLPNDNVKYVLSKFYDDDVDRIAGKTSLKRLLSSLQPYQPEKWFFN